MKLNIGYLYGDIMNTYGDVGNIITLTKRCEWRGVEVEVKQVTIGDKLKAGECDLFFFGGGQDVGQTMVGEDLPGSKAEVILAEVERGVPLLSICGGYQLLGAFYKPRNGPKIPGIGLFKVYTEAGDKRMIGNIVIELRPHSSQLMTQGLLVGFENHSGKTFLQEGGVAIGKVVKGFGNNGEDRTEGCVYKNAIGCYMHGSLLPKNPVLADWLIKKALEVKYGKEVDLENLNDEIENQAHEVALQKFG